MKILLLAVIGVGLCIQGRAASLSTTDGKTYENITMQRADPDGLYIEYTLPGGGIGMSKVKFSRLSADQQKQFGYDAARAKDYEAGVAKANQDVRDESARLEKATADYRASQLVSEQNESRSETEHMIALAQLKEAEADLARAENGGNSSGADMGYGYGYGGAALVAVPGVGGINGGLGLHNRDNLRVTIGPRLTQRHEQPTIGAAFRAQAFRAATHPAFP